MLSAAQMQRFDKKTIEYYGIPSCVLMERASMCAFHEIERRFPDKKTKILVLCGKGNNGGDGLVLARLCILKGYICDYVLVADENAVFSKENERQQQILEKYGCTPKVNYDLCEYDIVVDALFGIGISRELKEPYLSVVEKINQSEAYVISLDIPTGVNTDTGEIHGAAVNADLTITFGYRKKGQVLYPGCLKCGELMATDVGIYIDETILVEEHAVTCREFQLPRRKEAGNKGTFGKLLVVVGSENIAGAAILACEAAFALGCGMIKIITHANNRDALLTRLPECMLETYTDNTTETELQNMFQTSAAWADTLVIGPGIGTGETADTLVKQALFETELPLVMDADALNVCAAKNYDLKEASDKHNGHIILTPHMGEFARLLGCTVKDLAANKEEYVRTFAKNNNLTVVCKDARTFVCTKVQNGMFINLTGNDGMATAGSGDVLAGIAATFFLQEKDDFKAACNAVTLHGCSGDLAAKKLGKRSMKASDICICLKEIVRSIDEEDAEDK